jgi:hypothetical protein
MNGIESSEKDIQENIKHCIILIAYLFLFINWIVLRCINEKCNCSCQKYMQEEEEEKIESLLDEKKS